MKKDQIIKLAIALIVTLVAWFLPSEAWGIPDLTVLEQRVIAIFFFAALMWIFEVVPIWTVSVLVMAMLLLTVSSSMLTPVFGPPANCTHLAEHFGKTVPYKDILAAWADPIVILFMGGFALAIAATKTGLDVVVAKGLMKPFGTKSGKVLLGFLLVTAVLSMFMSNTATAAMMIAIMAPVIRKLPAEGKGRVALTLAVPIGANVGGIGTPIGTPPNAIAMKYLGEIGFGQWMMVMVPYVIVLLVIAWLLLGAMYPFKQKDIVLQIEGKNASSKRDKRIVVITFIITVLFWLTDKLTGVNANVVAFIPLTVFAITGIIGKAELKQINWDVLWLVAGGFALGTALDKTGLAKHLVTSIPFDQWPTLIVIVGAGLICILMSTFMSNTASANLLMPILAAVAGGMGEALGAYGGPTTMLIGIALSASLAMALPISTPPNALAYATGTLTQGQMAKVGIIMGVVGLALGYVLLIFVGRMGWLG